MELPDGQYASNMGNPVLLTMLFCLYCLYNNNICELIIIHYRVARLVVKNTEIVVKKQCRLVFHYIHAPFIQNEAIFKLRFCIKIE